MLEISLNHVGNSKIESQLGQIQLCNARIKTKTFIHTLRNLPGI